MSRRSEPAEVPKRMIEHYQDFWKGVQTGKKFRHRIFVGILGIPVELGLHIAGMCGRQIMDPQMKDRSIYWNTPFH